MKVIRGLKPLMSKDELTEDIIPPKYTDLRQVMDYTRPLSIFYSGVEYEAYLDILHDLGIKNFLMSYEYLKGAGRSQLKKYEDMHLFIDSGAFTYMSNPEFESYTVEQWEEQIKTYLKWAEKHKDSIFAIADLDLQYLVGNETVYRWRKEYFEPFMLRTGIPVCFIYHEEGDEQWEYMCKRYPYIGLSLNVDGNIDEASLREKFRIAEKYNTLIQGMASTRTGLLTQYPFYTVDSTTWNVGLKYGEISVWTGSKMSRIKKEDFESKAFPAIQRYDISFDFDLIREEDKTEMIRVNAYAFVQAEKYIDERLKSLMYWFKARTVHVDVDNLPDDFFPTVTELAEANIDVLKEYARKMNINPELSTQELQGILTDMTMFLNWDNEDYEGMKGNYDSNLIESLHDTHVNRIVSSEKEKIEDLINFYRNCLMGSNDKLLLYGTNFDREIKERESYIEEDDTELVDMTDAEVKEKLHSLLPAPSDEESVGASEIDELDEEIYRKADIVPTWGADGKFLKGQKRVQKPKRVYSSKYPKFACDTCFAAAKCPEYKSGYVCAYSKMFERFDTRDMADIIQGMQGIVEHNMTRMQRAMVMEVLNGTIDPTVTQLMQQNVNYLNMLKQMYEFGSPEVLKQTKVVRADGSIEQTTSITNPQSGGILEKLFGSITNNKTDNEDDLVEIKEEVEDKKKNPRYDVNPDEIFE